MNFLNPEALKKHLSPEHNYLESFGDKTLEEVETKLEDSLSEPTQDSILVVVEKEPLGRKNSNIPDFLRKTVAVLGHTTDETHKDIANEFGISKSSAAHIMEGRNGGRGHINEELRNLTNELKEVKKTSRTDIEDVALLRTLETLNILTPSDIECLGAKDKADVAVKLSKVAANMRDKVVNNDNRMVLIIKAPPVRDNLDNYETIEVG